MATKILNGKKTLLIWTICHKVLSFGLKFWPRVWLGQPPDMHQRQFEFKGKESQLQDDYELPAKAIFQHGLPMA